jgi:hypothetical protein
LAETAESLSNELPARNPPLTTRYVPGCSSAAERKAPVISGSFVADATTSSPTKIAPVVPSARWMSSKTASSSSNPIMNRART